MSNLEELVNVIDHRMKTLGQKIQSQAHNFSDFQVQQSKLEKKCIHHGKRLDDIEEKDEDVDLEALEGKEAITIKDITDVMK